jgi:predicted ArsR family transcriptional regulator
VNERIDNLRGIGRLVDEPAPDEEVIGLWVGALDALEDACLSVRTPNRRLTAAYDAGRTAALAVVRAADLRVRANNHHEVTLAAAGFLVQGALEPLLQEFQERRMDRIQIEYGWAKRATDEEVRDAVSQSRAILELAAAWIREHRRSVAAEIQFPG